MILWVYETAFSIKVLELGNTILNYLIFFINILGVLFIVYGIFASLYNYSKKDVVLYDGSSKIILLRSFFLGLNFLIASEIIATILAKTLTDALILAVVVIIRISIGVFISKEIRLLEERNSKKKVEEVKEDSNIKLL